MTTRLLGIAVFLLVVFVGVPWAIAASGRTDLYYTLTSVALLAIASGGVWLTFYIGRINIGQGAYALVGGYVSAVLVTAYGVPFWWTLLLAGLVGGLLVSIIGVNLGMGGPTSIKAFMMVMIGGAGVISGAIAGGFILGMMESVGLTLLAGYGDVTYLVIFASLMIFLAIRPQGLMGKPWG